MIASINSRAGEGVVDLDEVCLHGRHCRLCEVVHEGGVSEVGINLLDGGRSAPGDAHLATVLVVGRVGHRHAGLAAFRKWGYFILEIMILDDIFVRMSAIFLRV